MKCSNCGHKLFREDSMKRKICLDCWTEPLFSMEDLSNSSKKDLLKGGARWEKHTNTTGNCKK